MAVIACEKINLGLKEGERVEFVRAQKPRTLWHAKALGALIRAEASQLSNDFPNLAARYDAGWLNIVHRLHNSKKIARTITHGTTYTGTPFENEALIGMLTMIEDCIPEVSETRDGINVAAWLEKGSQNRGYLARLAPELAQELDPNRTVWIVARHENLPVVTLLANIGMTAHGSPEDYDIGDGVAACRQLYIAPAGDIVQTAQAHVETHYPVKVITPDH